MHLSTSVNRCAALSILTLLVGCRAPTSADEGVLAGTAAAIYATPPGAWYAGEVRVSGTRVGDIRAYITHNMPIAVRTRGGMVRSASLASIVVGDSIAAWYDTEGGVLRSDPPVYPVLRLEIRR